MAESKWAKAIRKAEAAGDIEAADVFRERARKETEFNADPDAYRLNQGYKVYRKARAAGDQEAMERATQEIQQLTAGMRQREATNSSTPLELGLAGVGAGIKGVENNFYDIAGSVPGLGAIKPNPQQWADEREAAGYLRNTEAGNFGAMTGESAVTMPLGAAVSAAAPMLGMAGRGAATVADTMAQTALMSEPGERLQNVALGLGLHGGGGKVAGALRDAATGIVKPSASAEYLKRKGVSGLTLGQMAPDSAFAQFEQAGQSVPGIGNILKSQRDVGAQSWQDAVIRETAPPSVTVAPGGVLKLSNPTRPGGATVSEKLASTYDDFGEAYAPIKDAPLEAFYDGQPLSGLFKQAFAEIPNDPGVFAPKSTRRDVAKYLADQATALDHVPFRPETSAAATQRALPQSTSRALALTGGQAPQPTGQIKAEALLKMRSDIRNTIRLESTKQNPDFAAIRMWRNAEDGVTSALESNLPKSYSDALRQIDSQYAKHATASKAVASAGDAVDGLTPGQLSRAARSATEKGAYARGAGGEMRQLAKAGQESLETTVPPTGARILTAGGPIAKWFTSSGAALANSPGPKRLLLGETAPQRAAKMTEEQLKQLQIAEALRRALPNRIADYVDEGE